MTDLYPFPNYYKELNCCIVKSRVGIFGKSWEKQGAGIFCTHAKADGYKKRCATFYRLFFLIKTRHSPISTSLCPPSAVALHHVAKVWMATKFG